MMVNQAQGKGIVFWNAYINTYIYELVEMK